MTYHENGNRFTKTRHFKNRAREVRYYPDGTLEKKGWSRLLLNDPKQLIYYRDGKWKLFDEDGKLFRILFFGEGRVIDVIKELDP